MVEQHTDLKISSQSQPDIEDSWDSDDSLITPVTNDATPNNAPFKEKFVSIYELLFAGKEVYRTKEHFWDELFLLRINSVFLENCILLSSEEELMNLTKILHVIFQACLDTLLDDSHIRRTNALQVFFYRYDLK